MNGAGLIALDERGVLAVSGPQRAKFLHNLLSNAVLDLAPGQGTRAALMDAKGHLLALMRVLVTASEILLELPADALPGVEALLVHYRVGAPVRFARRPTSVLVLLGPEADRVLQAAGGPLPGAAPDSHAAGTLAGAAALVARAPDLPAGARVVHVAPESAAVALAALRAAGATPLSRAGFDALRVAQGRPLFGVDITAENLLHETGLVAEYHSPSKGCYVGQEVVARLEARGGNVNKLLRGLRLSAPASPGAAIEAGDGKEIGRITSAGTSDSLGAIAMGYVHRSAAAPGTEVRVGGAPARVEALPLEAA